MMMVTVTTQTKLEHDLSPGGQAPGLTERPAATGSGPHPVTEPEVPAPRFSIMIQSFQVSYAGLSGLL